MTPYEETCARLDSFTKLQANWDGEGAAAIGPATVAFAKKILPCLPPPECKSRWETERWSVFPIADGFIEFEGNGETIRVWKAEPDVASVA